MLSNKLNCKRKGLTPNIAIFAQLPTNLQRRDVPLEWVSQDDHGAWQTVRPKVQDVAAPQGSTRAIGTLAVTAHAAQQSGNDKSCPATIRKNFGDN